MEPDVNDIRGGSNAILCTSNSTRVNHKSGMSARSSEYRTERRQYITTADGKRHEIDDRLAMAAQKARRRFEDIDDLKQFAQEVGQQGG